MERIRFALPLWVITIGWPLALSQALTTPALAQGSDGLSTLCKFTSGPRAGQVQDYSPMAPIRVGSPCQDGVSSNGIVVGRSAGGPTPPGTPSSSLPNGTTLTCKFTNGPRAGQVQDYSRVPNAVPAQIGSACTDGMSSTGVAIAPSNAGGDGASSDGGNTAMSTICQFTYGPKAGGWHDYAPRPPKSAGSSCQDGISSAGTV